MKSLQKTFQTFSLGRVLVACLLAGFLFITTACSGTGSTMSAADTGSSNGLNHGASAPVGSVDVSKRGAKGNTLGQPVSGLGTSYDENRGQQTELYAPTQPRKGGMNTYSDDPRADSEKLMEASKARVNEAKGNLQYRTDDTKDYARNYRSGAPLDERTKKLGEDVADSTKDLTSGVAEGTQRGVQNLKGNLKKAADTVTGAVDSAQDNAGNALENAGKSASQFSQEKGRDIEKVAKQAGDPIKNRS